MRVFVIGNGPSLKRTPLDLLQGETCVAMNRIHLVYPRTTWRPTHYVKTDHNPSLTEIWKDETRLQYELGITCYLWEGFRYGLPEKHPNHDTLPDGLGDLPGVVWVERCEHHYYHHDSRIDRRSHGWHFPGLCTAYSGISPAIQVAYMLGADEIYLVGCDLGYGRSKGYDHFSTDYSKDTRPLGEWDTLEVLEAHKICKQSCPVPIYNASLGGTLNLYPCVNLTAIL